MTTHAQVVPSTPASYAPRRADAGDALADGVRLASSGLPQRAIVAFERALLLADTPAQLAEIHRRIGAVHRSQGLWEPALAAVRRSGDVARRSRLHEAEAEAANAEGNVHLARGAHAEASPCYARGLALEPSPRVRAMLLQNLGTCAGLAGDSATARTRFEDALRTFRSVGDERGVVTALNNLAVNRMEQGEWAAALPHLCEVIRLASRLGDLELRLGAACNRAEVLSHLGRLEDAQASLSEAMGFFHSSGNRLQRAQCLRVLGDVYAAYDTADQDDSARRCYALARETYADADAPHFVAVVDAATARLPRRS